MPYSWEDVVLGIDVSREEKEKEKTQREIQKEMEDEANWMAGGQLVGSLLCGALFGPAGAFICGQIAKYGADYHFKWEEMSIDEGKFNKDIVREYNRELEEGAKEQTTQQLLSTALDAGKMFMMAGGPEALKAGEDIKWSTYGHGDDAWSVFGKEGDPVFGEPFKTPENFIVDGQKLATGTELTPVGFQDTPALWEKGAGLGTNLLNVGQNLGGMYKDAGTLDNLYQLSSYLFGSKDECEEEGYKWDEKTGKCVGTSV